MLYLSRGHIGDKHSKMPLINDNKTKAFVEEILQEQKDLDTLNRIFQPFFTSIHISRFLSDNYIVEGELKLDNPSCDFHFNRTANVEIELNLHNLIGFQPVVKVHELWMKHSCDWHCASDNRLCWELDQRWKEKLEEIKRSNPPSFDFQKYAISWCIESSACLIRRHWYAHMNNISEWPQEWKFWPHGEEGRKTYERRKRKNENKKLKRPHRRNNSRV